MALEIKPRCESELSGQEAFESRQVRLKTWSADFSQAAESSYFLCLSRRSRKGRGLGNSEELG